ncbi:hypothetical protein pb186bvf_003100 [Paramecium bursaria]
MGFIYVSFEQKNDRDQHPEQEPHSQSFKRIYTRKFKPKGQSISLLND